ncbi:hypothetical protein HGA88_04800 [Candidatus Roizmanbacteria bacterium]|nr:hypothetical protein [Candidatus Roizmanbacteria bacterium]
MNLRVLLLFLLIIGPFFLGLNIPLSYSQQPTPFGQKIVYELPYPGLTPDSPFYWMKSVRDMCTDFFTRDLLKKSELYLHLSDKRIAMAITLAKQGKNKLAISTVKEAEELAAKIPNLFVESKKQGANPSGELISRVKLSAEKHKELIEELKRTLPQGEAELLQSALDLNQKTESDLKRF